MVLLWVFLIIEGLDLKVVFDVVLEFGEVFGFEY